MGLHDGENSLENSSSFDPNPNAEALAAVEEGRGPKAPGAETGVAATAAVAPVPFKKKKNWRPVNYEVTVHGSILQGHIDGVRAMFCRYQYNFGSDWVLHKGSVAYGITHIAELCSSIGGGRSSGVAWNFPLEAHFTSTNAHGWPQLVVAVYTQDWFNRDIVAGYGATHVPLTPGKYTRRVFLYAPQTSSTFQRVMNYWFGARPEYAQFLFPGTHAGRELTRVRSGGYVDVEFDVNINHDAGRVDHGEFMIPFNHHVGVSWWQKGLSYFKK